MAKKSARKKSAPNKAARKPAKAKMKAKARVKQVKAKAQARKVTRQAAPPEAPPGPPKLTGPSVVHWEVQARDPIGQQRFFGELFGWNVDANNPQNYGMVNPAGPGSIGGGIGATTDEPRAMFYIQVPSIVDTLDKAATMGGATVMPRTDIGMIVMAQFRDPEGNIIGLVEG